MGCVLEYMAERSVADVVQQRGQKGHALPRPVRQLFVSPPDDFDEPAGSVVNADGVRESAVRRARIHQVGKSQLPDATQSLEFGGIE